MADALRSEKSWAAAMKKADIDPGSPGSEYQGMKEFFASGQYTLEAQPSGIRCCGQGACFVV